MSYNKTLMLAAGLIITALTSSNAHAVNCSISYYCYRSMTPGPAPEQGSAALTRRTVAASNRLSRVSSNNRRARPAGANRVATTRVAAPRTLEQRQAEARRREQQQQRQLAARRRQAQQQEQQRLAQIRRQQQQRNAASSTRPANDRERLIAQQRAAYLAQQRASQQRTPPAQQRTAQQQAAQQRAARQRQTQQQATTASTSRPATTAPARPSILTSLPSQQSCQTIARKITELNRQAILRSKEGKSAQAQHLFKAVEQLKKEAAGKQCGII